MTTSRPFGNLPQSVTNLPAGYQEPTLPKAPPPVPAPPPRPNPDNELVQLNVPVTRGTRNKAKSRAQEHGLNIKEAVPLLVKAWTEGHVEIPREYLAYLSR